MGKPDFEQQALDILNAYTEGDEFAEGWEFPIGLIGDIESALQSARATALEEACRAVCDLCREGKKPSKTMDEGGHDVFFHNELINGCSWWACGAEAIRAKMAEGDRTK